MPPVQEAPIALAPEDFRRRFFWLILLTWTIPPVFGLGFILYLGILTPAQMLALMTHPLEPLFILFWLFFALGYFTRYVRPFATYLANPGAVAEDEILHRLRRFPLHYWGWFLLYLLMAPTSVLIGAEMSSGHVATPLDWFRIHLVALIVSIIVGLPIFFLILDLFGRALGGLSLRRPVVTIKTKVFLIGALVPLLIDTILVQYYWTRTGFFTLETFLVWLSLELLAIGGSLIFVRSFGQSLRPLEGAIDTERRVPDPAGQLRPCSTDELGVLTDGYRHLLNELRVRSEILDVANRVLRSAGESRALPDLLDAVVEVVHEVIRGDMAFLILKDPVRNELVGVAQTGAKYRAEGHFRLSLDEVSMAVNVYHQKATLAIDDVARDPRVSPRMRAAFRVISAIGTPLLLDGEPIGVLMSISRERRVHYTRWDQMLLESLAREAAMAIHATRLREERNRLEQRQQAQHQALLTLSRAQAAAEEDPAAVLAETTETVARAMAVGRVGIWLFNEAHDELICQDLYEAEPDRHGSGLVLQARDYPDYFRALDENRVIAANDAHQAPETRAFSGPYLSPNGIGAMLDAPLRRGSRVSGVLCIEHVGGPRMWELDEQNFAASVADMTSLVLELWDHRQTTEALRRHQELLEERVAERTEQLLASNRELASFSYSVSHDLRSPLRAIDGFSHALLEEYGDRLDATGVDYLERVRKAAQRMGNLIDALLKLSRLSRSELHWQRVDLSALAREIAGELTRREPARDVHWHIEPGLFAEGDPGLLRALLENLLGNAWKYTGQTPQPAIRLTREIHEGQTAFCVSDNGAGFDMAHAAKLFAPFHRLHTDAEFPGSGIGLATAERIVRRHGGRIWAQAAPGEGAKFCFTLGRANGSNRVIPAEGMEQGEPAEGEAG